MEVKHAKPRVRKQGARGAPVNVATTIAPSGGNGTLHVYGSDRFAHIPDLASKPENSVVLNQAITGASFARLKHLSSAYQRIRWTKLVFRVVPMSPTNISGGLCASFVADASDNVGTGTNAISRLLAQKGAKVFKAWESATISHRCIPDLLYTSEPPKGDIRMSSPGRFVLAVDSAISVGTSQKVPVTVYVDWAAVLSEPSIEGYAPNGSGDLTVNAGLYGRTENTGLWFRDTPGGDDPRSVIPGIQFDVVYRLQSKRYANLVSGHINFDKVVLKNDKTHGVTLFVVGYDNKHIDSKFESNCWVIESGDTLRSEATSLNQTGSEFLCLQETENSYKGPGEMSRTLDEKLERSQDSYRRRTDSFEILPDPVSYMQEFPTSRQQVRSMECQRR